MKDRVLFFKLVFIVVVFLFLQNNVFAKDNWTKVTSKNFTLIGNADEKEIINVATKLEQFRETFQKLFSNLKFKSPVPTNVIVFKNENSFKSFKPIDDNGKVRDWVAGYFLKGTDVNYIVLSLHNKKQDVYRTIFHEYVHFLIDNNFGRNKIPAWFNEGIAEYYEQFLIEDDQKVTLGALNQGHLFILARNNLLPLETIFNTDYYSLNKQGNHGASMFYAQSWALVHYLIQGNNGARANQLNNFVQKLLLGEQLNQAFNLSFNTDFATMQTELKKYLEQKSLPISIITFKEKLRFDTEISAIELSENQAKTYLADLLAHSKNRLDEAEKILQEVLADEPNSSMANTSLGFVKMRQKKFTEAKNILEKAISDDNKNFFAYYNYAFTLSREGMTEYGFVNQYTAAHAEKIRENLDKAIQLNPEFPETYHLLAFVNLIRNERLDESINLLNKAIQFSPGNQWFVLRLAEIYMRKKEFEKAKINATKVLQNASDDSLKLYAQNTLNLINSYESQLEELERLKKNPPKNTQKEEKKLTDEEIKELQKKAENESLNQSLRRLKPNEQRVLGVIAKIDCSKASIIFSIKSENKPIFLQTTSLDKVKLISFVQEMNESQIGCGSINRENLALITFIPNNKTNNSGEIVSIEFVPKEFKLLP